MRRRSERLAANHRRVALDVLAARLALEVARRAGEEAEVVAEKGISSRETISGLPTLLDSICASSSALSRDLRRAW